MAKLETSAAFMALVQASAGAAGGVFSSLTLQPLEVVKTRIQISQDSEDSSTCGTMNQIVQNEGITGLFRGAAAKCTETGFKNFVFFYIYDALNQMAKARVKKLTTPQKLFLGYAAGVGNTLLTMPLEVLSTKVQVVNSNVGVFGVLQEILEDEGVAGLFKGLGFNILLCCNPAIQNTCFDQLKDKLLKRAMIHGVDKPSLTPFQGFMLGCVAKAIATIITFPLVRLKTMLQAGYDPEAKSPSSLRKMTRTRTSSTELRKRRSRTSSTEMLRSISFRSDLDPETQSLFMRFTQLYRGIGAALMKSVLGAGLLYMTKDQIALIVIKIFKLTARAFFRRDGRTVKLGALSGRPLAS